MKPKQEEKNKKATDHSTHRDWHEMNRKQRRSRFPLAHQNRLPKAPDSSAAIPGEPCLRMASEEHARHRPCEVS